jgi:hypothetical protein
MKKLMLILTLTLLFTKLLAPAKYYKELSILASDPIYAYNITDPVLRAFIDFESNYIERIVNPYSGARGLLQFMPDMIKEVNRICKLKGITKRYTWRDAYYPDKSIEMWYVVMHHRNPEYDLTKACKIWFGIGVQHDGMTWVGYKKEIEKRL